MCLASLAVGFSVVQLLIFPRIAASNTTSFRDEQQEKLAGRLQEYEIVVPQIVTENGSFLNSELQKAVGSERFLVTFHAFGEEFQLDLKRNHKLVDLRFTSEILDNSYEPPRQNSTRNCYYIGTVRYRSQSSVAISACHGLMGLIETQDDDYFLEPMARAQKQHLFYKRSTLLASSPRNTQSSRKCALSSSNPQGYKTSKNKKWKFWQEFNHRQRRSMAKDVTIQLLVVVDKEMISFHGNQSIEEYVLTIMNMVAELFRDPSIGTEINIEVSKLMLLFNVPKGLSITRNGDRTLDSFCKWQKWITRDKSSVNPTYDGALLLTRKDICASRYTACDTVGMAFLHGMCDPRRRCSVCQDNGLNVAFTVAHEIGHNLGAYHDGDGNTCPDSAGLTPHIMSPQWLENRNKRGTMKWSRCSHSYISLFLNSKAGKCLRNRAKLSPLQLPTQLPGVAFTVDKQCKQQYGNRARHCHKYKHRLCQQLWCEIEGEKLCRSKLNPPATGTACAPGKWCMYGTCVYNHTMPLKRDGRWGPWTMWSECSRTCGMGVSVQERQCDSPSPLNGGRYCEGESKTYRTCNVKPCAPGSTGFRALQCESFKGIEYRGGKYDWVPVVSDGQPCALFCKPKDTQYRFSAKLAPKVIDGTPCRPGSIDICIDGKCQNVGCDFNIGSGAQEDICGVCKGNGTTCRTVEGKFNQFAGSGYVEAAVIPKGARSIAVRESKPCTSFLALRADGGTYYINGNWRIQLPGDVKADGTVFRYIRKGTLEKIIARGPTNAPLHIMVLYYGFNFGVEYRYAMPLNGKKEDKRDMNRHRFPHDASHGWVHGGWGECNVHCGGGIRKSLRMRCVRFHRGNVSLVDHFNCQRATKPRQEERVCNVHRCPIWWAVSPWRPCSTTCGQGLQYRSVQCMGQTQDGSIVERPDHLCPRDKPSGVQNCIRKACYLNWIVGPWSQCHALCGFGHRLRSVHCPVKGKCAHWQKPSPRKSCFKGSCYDWSAGEWGRCSARCGVGKQKRKVSCVHRLTGEPGSNCNSAAKPAPRRTCKIKDCKSLAVVLETVCNKDRYSREHCQAVVRYNFCSSRVWLDLCCKTCQDAGRL